jgi:group II intron reverse transcriptase/maturase
MMKTEGEGQQVREQTLTSQKGDVRMNVDKLNRQLERLEKVVERGAVVKDLFRILRYPELWQLAYANIYSNKGAMTKGVDDDSLDGMSNERIANLIDSVMSETYRPKPVRRAYIPKKDGSKRPLGVPTGDDKLVQAVIKILLEHYHEGIFSDNSHGFRPNKSCHTALEEIGYVWKGTKWFIEFDVKGCFDNIDHKILMNLLKKRINDKRFLSLIWRFLKAGYMEDWKYNQTYSGTPQGGIISPILANIYLHELDDYVERLIEDFNVGKRRPQNPEYDSITQRIYGKRQNLRKHGRKLKWISELKELQEQRSKMPSVIENTDKYKRLRYCRYADDFLCGVTGSFTDAKNIMHSITEFLDKELSLETSEGKTGIKRATRNIEFLGYRIKVIHSQKIVKAKSYGTWHKKRTIQGHIRLSIPEHKIMGFAKSHGYGVYATNKAKHRPYLLISSEVEIVTMYNSEIRGFANYYILAKNVKYTLSRLGHLAFRSLIKTLAGRRKTKMTVIYERLKQGNEWVLKYKMNDIWKELKIFQPKHLTKRPDGTDRLPLTEHLYKTGTELTQRMNANLCEYCGNTSRPMEVHHVRKLKDLQSKKHLENWERAMIARNRKTLILCNECHHLLHQGKLPDIRKPN